MGGVTRVGVCVLMMLGASAWAQEGEASALDALTTHIHEHCEGQDDAAISQCAKQPELVQPTSLFLDRVDLILEALRAQHAAWLGTPEEERDEHGSLADSIAHLEAMLKRKEVRERLESIRRAGGGGGALEGMYRAERALDIGMRFERDAAWPDFPLYAVWQLAKLEEYERRRQSGGASTPTIEWENGSRLQQPIVVPGEYGQTSPIENKYWELITKDARALSSQVKGELESHAGLSGVFRTWVGMDRARLYVADTGRERVVSAPLALLDSIAAAFHDEVGEHLTALAKDALARRRGAQAVGDPAWSVLSGLGAMVTSPEGSWQAAREQAAAQDLADALELARVAYESGLIKGGDAFSQRIEARRAEVVGDTREWPPRRGTTSGGGDPWAAYRAWKLSMQRPDASIELDAGGETLSDLRFLRYDFEARRIEFQQGTSANAVHVVKVDPATIRSVTGG
ncbi:MAG: hypothetical protein R3B57_06575 [Phycisphaerales bacterium]